jgi:hypothetical protein
VHGVFKALSTVVDIDNCDRADARYMLPLGVVVERGHVFWIAQVAGWNMEYYEVVEVNEHEIAPVVERFGGGC